MVSEIIKIEKERQDYHFNCIKAAQGIGEYNPVQTLCRISEHKQSLINLKKYIEWVLRTIEYFGDEKGFRTHLMETKIQITEEIKELDVMIKNYGKD